MMRAALALMAFTPFCGHPMVSVEEQWGVDVRALVDSGVSDSPYPVAVGSQWCGEDLLVDRSLPSKVTAGAFAGECVDMRTIGAVDLRDGCIQVSERGPGVVLLTPRDDCPWDVDPVLVEDRFEVRGVPLAELRSAPRTQIEQWIEREGITESATDAPIPIDLGLEEDTRALGGQWVGLLLRLVEADGDVVAFDAPMGSLSLEGGRLDHEGGEWVRVLVPVGVEADLTLTLGDASIVLTRVVGVEATDLHSVELVVPRSSLRLQDWSEEVPSDLPPLDGIAMVHALYRDVDGRPVRGVPTRFTVDDGPFVLAPAEPDRSHFDPCEPLRAGTVEVQITAAADLASVAVSDTVVASYTVSRRTRRFLVRNDLYIPGEFERPADCPQPRRCGCNTAPSGGAAFAGFIALILWLRRRQS